MLNILFGKNDEVIPHPPLFFDNTYEDEWLTDDFSRQIIRDIDKGEVLSPNCIETEALGGIPPTKIAGGTKTLLLMNFDDKHIFNASSCGDNCAKWILKIAEKKDLTINLNHIMDFGTEDFEAKILNNGKIVHGMKEYVLYAGDFFE